jgi:glyoxylase-like metal-dependent hydrolase (beta-lactamase superfamily II)
VSAATDTFVSRRRFGDIATAVISVGTFEMTPKPYRLADDRYPDTELDATGRRTAGLTSLYVEAGGTRIVIDPGHWERDPDSMLDDLAPSPGLDAALADLGVAADSIDVVLLTHGHFDHCTGVLDGSRLRFPNATHLLRAEDWDPDGGLGSAWHAELRRYLDPVQAAGRLQLVDAPEHAICDGVAMIHARGETPGHAVVRIDGGGGEVLLHLADLVHLPGEASRIDWAAGLHERNVEHMIESRRRFLAAAATPGTVALFAHGAFPAWGTVYDAGPNAWRWTYERTGEG